MSRLLLVADLHLEKGMDYSDDRLGEQEAVWAQALHVGIEHEVDAVLFAGDATEYRAPSSAARAAFQRPLMGLGVPVLAIPGNHDVKHPRYPTALDLMSDEFGGKLLYVSREPELRHIGGVTVATLPWVPLGTFVAKRNGGDRQAAFEEAAEALVVIAEALAAKARREYHERPVVLLGHWALDQASTPAGMPAALFHEPVLPVDRLSELFDAVVFGHVHKPERWGNVVSVGSPMPLDFGEAGCEHGVWILDLAPYSQGDEPWTFVPIESRPFVTLDLTGDQAWMLAEGEAIVTGRPTLTDAIVRLRYTASEERAAQISDAALRRVLLEAGAHRVWQITPQVERRARARVEGMGALSPFDAIDAYIEARGIKLRGVRERAREVLQT